MTETVTDARQSGKRQRVYVRQVSRYVLKAMSDERLETPTTIGARIALALKAEGRKIAPTEQQAGFTTGHLGRIIRGERGSTMVDIERMKVLADVLHVTPEWLILGVGPMRRGGREATPAEEAIVFARHAGCREDAIQAAWERFKGNESHMTAIDWALAIHNEANMLDRSGIQRPELTAEEKSRIQRAKKKLERVRERAEEEGKRDAALEDPGKRRAVGDK